MKVKKLKIIYEDKDIIVINKPSKILTIKDNQGYKDSLYEQVSLYLYRKNKNNKVFIVHRLDKDTSGLIVFAKNKLTKNFLQENWDKLTVRKYNAICVNNFQKNFGSIKSYLKETKTLLVYSTKNNEGKYAHTDYHVINKNTQYALVDIDIKTGRKNQIRVHLNDINCPIMGDKKYGKNNKAPYLMLNANYLKFIHPKTKEIMEFTIKNPSYFDKYIK